MRQMAEKNIVCCGRKGRNDEEICQIGYLILCLLFPWNISLQCVIIFGSDFVIPLLKMSCYSILYTDLAPLHVFFMRCLTWLLPTSPFTYSLAFMLYVLVMLYFSCDLINMLSSNALCLGICCFFFLKNVYYSFKYSAQMPSPLRNCPQTP